MPRQRIDLDPIDALSILDEEGRVDRDLEPVIPPDDLRRLYRTFLLARRFDERMLVLQRQGRIGTYLPAKGHEAAVLGSVYPLRPTDWLVPVWREWAAYVWRGWPLENLILLYAGLPEGTSVPAGIRDLPVCVPMGTHVPHAVGLACAARARREDSVVLCYFGDGASSEGITQEAMNFAGVFQAPIVFVCINNQWAISIPRSRQTRAKTLAHRALAYGLPGVQVDGNDLLAMVAVTREAVARAREGRRAHAHRGRDVPSWRSLHGGRPDEVPRGGRGQGVGGEGAVAALPPLPQAKGSWTTPSTRGSRRRRTPRCAPPSSAPRRRMQAARPSTCSITSTPTCRRRFWLSARSSLGSLTSRDPSLGTTVL